MIYSSYIYRKIQNLKKFNTSTIFSTTVLQKIVHPIMGFAIFYLSSIKSFALCHAIMLLL